MKNVGEHFLFYFILLLKNKSEKPKKMVFQVFQSENFEEKKNSFSPNFWKNGVYIHD
jgi:hypothetical protein